ncbi:hypothetical protein D4764_01G0020920 [Takifugu flavidus]|uniref:Uncharacterized protein n=1 Tax=Takifugu flavidus TaxID=433684 RepID=A0A5C6PUA1_9TELE|nr:hypothetical protein D4764_01G0020920 [Takifugu flavidus]
MQSRGEDAVLLEDTGWTLDLAFLTDITGKRNSLNWELQGKAPERTRGGLLHALQTGFIPGPRQAANPSRWATGEQVNMLGRLETLGTPPAGGVEEPLISHSGPADTRTCGLSSISR